MKSSHFIACVFCVLAAASAHAEEASQATAAESEPGLFENLYVAPMATYFKPDSRRCAVDDGLGATAIIGYRREFAGLELWLQYLPLDAGECSYTVPDGGDLDSNRDPVTEPAHPMSLDGAGVALRIGPFSKDWFLARFFALIGIGTALREGHPQYGSDDYSMLADGGIGYVHPFTIWGVQTGVRTELRYRFDFQQSPYPQNQEPAPKDSYRDMLLNVGLELGGWPPEAPAPAEPAPVQVVQVVDTDGDGVPDERDQCPETPAEAKADDSGCVPPEPKPAVPTIETAVAGDRIVLHGVNFETARATLTTNAKTILDGVAEKLAARPELHIEVGGHTDARGSDSYNQDLSERRARSVMVYLTEHGIAAERLTAVGYGEAEPVDSNDTDEGMERNRRVELKVLDLAGASQQPPASEAPAEAPAAEPATAEPYAAEPTPVEPSAGDGSATEPSAAEPSPSEPTAAEPDVPR